jgi:prepilin-type N-terminal cleavage/methylation domain-containing protein
MGNDAFPKKRRNRVGGMTMIELLCCLGIITILAAMYLGVIADAFVHIKKFLRSMQ